MRFLEGCGIIAIDYALNDPEKLSSYIVEMFRIARKVPVYVAVSPSTVVTKISGAKRRIVVGVGSAIVCDESVLSKFSSYIEIAESVWVDVELLMPLQTSSPCRKAVELGLEIEVDRYGVPAYCIDDEEDYGKLEALSLEIADRGLIDFEVANLKGEEIYGIPSLALRFTPFFLLVKNLAFLRGRALKVRTVRLELPPRAKVLYAPCISIGGTDIVFNIGKGFVIDMDPLDSYSKALYMLSQLFAHLLPSDSPRAQLYVSRLLGRNNFDSTTKQ